MKINSIQQQNFGKIFIAENQENRIALGIIKEVPQKSLEALEYRINRVSQFQNTHVHVTEEGDVIVKYKDKNNNNKSTTIIGNVSLFTKYNMALHQATRIGDTDN